MKRFAPLLVLLIAGCVLPRGATDIARMKAASTPKEWSVGEVWLFETIALGKRTESVKYEITDEAVETCTSGKWKRLKLLTVGGNSNGGVPSVAAYEVSGSFLILNLKSNWCDINDEIIGELKGGAFKGVREAGGIFGSEKVGKVSGQIITQ